MGFNYQQPGKVKKVDLIVFGVALAVIVALGDLGDLVGRRCPIPPSSTTAT